MSDFNMEDLHQLLKVQSSGEFVYYSLEKIKGYRCYIDSVGGFEDLNTNLNEFIGVLSLVDAPRLRFEDSCVIVNDSTGRSKVKYFFSSEDTLTTPQKEITMPDADVKFTLTNNILNKIKRAAATLGHEEVSISNKDNDDKI